MKTEQIILRHLLNNKELKINEAEKLKRLYRGTTDLLLAIKNLENIGIISIHTNTIYLDKNVLIITNRKQFNTLDELANEVCNWFFISKDDLKSHERSRPIPDARKAFCYIAESLRNWKLQTIGDYINKNHSTVICAIREAKNLLHTDKSFYERIQLIQFNEPKKDLNVMP